MRGEIVSRRQMLLLCSLLLCAISGVLFYRLMPVLFPASDSEIELPLADCALALTACTVVLPGSGRFDFSLMPRPVRPLQPFDMQISVYDIAIDRVEIDFSGADMDMGVNRFVLKSEGANRFAGQGLLPVCISGKMTWRVSVMLETQGQRFVAPFLMEVGL